MNSNFSHLPMVGGITFPLLTTNELSPLRRDVKWSIRGGHIVYRFPRWSNKSPLIGSLRGTPGVLYHSILFLPGFIHSKKLPLTLSGGGIFLGWTYCQVHFHYKMWGRVVRSGTSKMGERDCVVCNERLTFCQNQVFDPKVINIFPPWHTVTPKVINNIYMFQYLLLVG
jgi:hypothetical protein